MLALEYICIECTQYTKRLLPNKWFWQSCQVKYPCATLVLPDSSSNQMERESQARHGGADLSPNTWEAMQRDHKFRATVRVHRAPL